MSYGKNYWHGSCKRIFGDFRAFDFPSENVRARAHVYVQKTLFYRVQKLPAIHKVFALKGV